jgi:hypothetical protein
MKEMGPKCGLTQNINGSKEKNILAFSLLSLAKLADLISSSFRSEKKNKKRRRGKIRAELAHVTAGD